jgi:hypothetical protein
LSTDDVISGLLEKFPKSKDLIQESKPYLESIIPSFFRGTIHAEATLMGLISYFTPDDDHERKRRDLEISNRDTFEEIFRPVCYFFAPFHSEHTLIFSGFPSRKACYLRGKEMLLVLRKTF